jgi:hypothetical protein
MVFVRAYFSRQGGDGAQQAAAADICYVPVVRGCQPSVRPSVHLQTKALGQRVYSVFFARRTIPTCRGTCGRSGVHAGRHLQSVPDDQGHGRRRAPACLPCRQQHTAADPSSDAVLSQIKNSKKKIIFERPQRTATDGTKHPPQCRTTMTDVEISHDSPPKHTLWTSESTGVPPIKCVAFRGAGSSPRERDTDRTKGGGG